MSARSIASGFYGSARQLIAPKLQYSQSIYEEVLKEHVGPSTDWLDLGCGHQVLPWWRADAEKQLIAHCRTIVGLDYSVESLTNHQGIDMKVRGDITKLSFRDESFDLVTANMVVEHLDDPARQFQEINRILRPGGIFIFHTPNALGHATIMARMVPGVLKDKMANILDGRNEEDVFETHYKANTQKQIAGLARDCEFDVVKMKMLVSDAIFAVVPPLAVLELIWIRALMTAPLKRFRTTIITVLRKREGSVGSAFGTDSNGNSRLAHADSGVVGRT
jgi:ubiquinone/menaquinone biosynthesis C-methylase UbiE